MRQVQIRDRFISVSAHFHQRKTRSQSCTYLVIFVHVSKVMVVITAATASSATTAVPATVRTILFSNMVTILHTVTTIVVGNPFTIFPVITIIAIGVIVVTSCRGALKQPRRHKQHSDGFGGEQHHLRAVVAVLQFVYNRISLKMSLLWQNSRDFKSH